MPVVSSRQRAWSRKKECRRRKEWAASRSSSAQTVFCPKCIGCTHQESDTTATNKHARIDCKPSPKSLSVRNQPSSCDFQVEKSSVRNDSAFCVWFSGENNSALFFYVVCWLWVVNYIFVLLHVIFNEFDFVALCVAFRWRQWCTEQTSPAPGFLRS